MAERTACQKCGTPLPPSPVGRNLCPRCLLGLGLEVAAAPPTGEEGHSRRAAVPPGDLPARIGLYRILEVIGQGGMGIVYLAEQDQPLRRRVALKVIKLGMDTREVVSRFESERQALALMSHPNIARVLDAGASEDGRPYFVMEYVPGLAITEYCDRQRLSTRDRLALFLPVCQAVQHAHQKGIIHRDLKPSNVIVTEEDGKPVPKVIDFGIAKAIHQPLVAEAVFTRHGVLVGTPEYMSPEQAERTGLEPDTTTDIYSLGVVLYELLAGALPFEGEALRKLGYDEILRVIREEEPARPSQRVTTLGATGTQIAERHGTDLPTLRKQLRGELDWITLRAMEKDRRRRYASASELAADIERHLADEPVAASPPSAAYRLKKAVRRNRVAVAAAAAVVVALVLGLVTSTVLLVRARRAEATARVEAARNALEVEATRALLDARDSEYVERTRAALALERRAAVGDPKRLALYLTNLVGFIDVSQIMQGEGPDWPPAIFMRQIDGEAIGLLAAANPEDDPALRQAVDMMTDYVGRRRPEERLALLRKAVELRERMARPDSSLSEALDRLVDGLLWEGRRLMASGRPSDALPLLEESSERGRQAHPSFPSGNGDVQTALGACLLALHRYPEAERYLLGAYRQWNRRDQLVQLIDLYREWGKPDEARRFDQSMFVDTLRDVGPMPPWGPIVSRSLGYSGTRDGRTIWLFECMYQAGRGLSRRVETRNTWSWSQNENAATGVMLNQAQEPPGTPARLLSLTAEEQARAAADPNTELSIVLGPLIRDPTRHRSLVVYALLTNPKRDWRHDLLGSSIAVWDDGADKPVRPIVRPGGPDPTLLFQGTEPRSLAGAVAVGDTLYLYATKPIFMNHSVTVAKAPLANCLDRGAWRYYAGAGRWSESPTDAVEIMQSSLQLTVHWNPYLRKYLAVTSRNLGIGLWTADRPEGPWSFRQEIGPVVGPPGPGQWTRHALAHVELARDGGRVEYLTYARPTEGFDWEVRLMEIVFR